jgi:hypothetical protein
MYEISKEKGVMYADLRNEKKGRKMLGLWLLLSFESDLTTEGKHIPKHFEIKMGWVNPVPVYRNIEM